MSAFGNILGIKMNLMMGQGSVLLPAPVSALEALQELEITMSATGKSGFKMVLAAGRDGPFGLLSASFVDNPLFQRNGRFVVSLIFAIKPVPIFDGIITRTQYMPGGNGQLGKLILYGRDISYIMGRAEEQVEWPAMDENTIANFIAAKYVTDGIVPNVIPPTVIDPAIPVDRTPQQNCSDMAYLHHIARRHGYHAFVDPGPVPGVSTLYWGPLPIPGAPQKALSVNQGPTSDAEDVTITHNGEKLATVSAKVQDRMTGAVTPVEAPFATTLSQGGLPDSITQAGKTRTLKIPTSGLNAMQAQARAMGVVNRSAQDVLVASGTINNLRYNDVLKPYQSVQLRGVGMIYNGVYTVSEVTHILKPGDYTQSFKMQRGDLYPIVPVVTPEVMSA